MVSSPRERTAPSAQRATRGQHACAAGRRSGCPAAERTGPNRSLLPVGTVGAAGASRLLWCARGVGASGLRSPQWLCRCYGKLPDLQSQCSRPKADCIAKIMECSKNETVCAGSSPCQCFGSPRMLKCAPDCAKELSDSLASPLCKPASTAPASSSSAVLDPCVMPGSSKSCSGNGACNKVCTCNEGFYGLWCQTNKTEMVQGAPAMRSPPPCEWHAAGAVRSAQAARRSSVALPLQRLALDCAAQAELSEEFADLRKSQASSGKAGASTCPTLQMWCPPKNACVRTGLECIVPNNDDKAAYAAAKEKVMSDVKNCLALGNVMCTSNSAEPKCATATSCEMLRPIFAAPIATCPNGTYTCEIGCSVTACANDRNVSTTICPTEMSVLCPDQLNCAATISECSAKVSWNGCPLGQFACSSTRNGRPVCVAKADDCLAQVRLLSSIL